MAPARSGLEEIRSKFGNKFILECEIPLAWERSELASMRGGYSVSPCLVEVVKMPSIPFVYSFLTPSCGSRVGRHGGFVLHQHIPYITTASPHAKQHLDVYSPACSNGSKVRQADENLPLSSPIDFDPPPNSPEANSYIYSRWRMATRGQKQQSAVGRGPRGPGSFL